jgi:hypothetical protein
VLAALADGHSLSVLGFAGLLEAASGMADDGGSERGGAGEQGRLAGIAPQLAVAVVVVEKPADAAIEGDVIWLAWAVAVAATARSCVAHLETPAMTKNAIVTTFSMLVLILVSVPAATILLCLSTDQPALVQPDGPIDVEVIREKSKELIETFSEQLKSESLTDDERRELKEAIEYHRRVVDNCERNMPATKR